MGDTVRTPLYYSQVEKLKEVYRMVTKIPQTFLFILPLPLYYLSPIRVITFSTWNAYTNVTTVLKQLFFLCIICEHKIILIQLKEIFKQIDTNAI